MGLSVITNSATIPLHLLDQLPGCWGCKDLHSRYVYVNQEYAQLIGFNNANECLNMTDDEQPGERRKFAKIFQEQDQYVISSKKRLRVLNIHPDLKQGWRAHLFTKSPWLDDEGNVKGVIFSGFELQNTAILEVGHWICRAAELNIKETIISSEKVKNTIKLNTRESEVLFLLLYGKKPQDMANTLHLSVKTIDNYVFKLREKFNAKSKRALIDLALEQGYASHIPNSLMKQPISIILKE